MEQLEMLEDYSNELEIRINRAISFINTYELSKEEEDDYVDDYEEYLETIKMILKGEME